MMDKEVIDNLKWVVVIWLKSDSREIVSYFTSEESADAFYRAICIGIESDFGLVHHIDDAGIKAAVQMKDVLHVYFGKQDTFDAIAARNSTLAAKRTAFDQLICQHIATTAAPMIQSIIETMQAAAASTTRKN